jgi:toxin-antitoxin system PIN domain toxin
VLLPDINVLLALAWPNHQLHAAALERLEAQEEPWCTCALTQLGFIRLSSNPEAIPNAKSPAEAAAMMQLMTSDPLHVYMDSLPPPAEAGAQAVFDKILAGGQVSEAYLLTLARKHGAKLLTFDPRLKALAGDEETVEVLGGVAQTA